MTIPRITAAEFRKMLRDKGLGSPVIDAAVLQAELSHKGQRRDNGNPYLTEHIYPVAYEVIQSYGGRAVPGRVIAAALLHDCIEDDPDFTYEKCRAKFGSEIADIVQALTKSAEENAPAANQEEKARLNRQYMRRVVAGPPEALAIKFADRYCNLATIPTIKATKPDKYRRYLRETSELFLPLAQARSPYFAARLENLLRTLDD